MGARTLLQALAGVTLIAAARAARHDFGINRVEVHKVEADKVDKVEANQVEVDKDVDKMDAEEHELSVDEEERRKEFKLNEEVECYSKSQGEKWFACTITGACDDTFCKVKFVGGQEGRRQKTTIRHKDMKVQNGGGQNQDPNQSGAKSSVTDLRDPDLGPKFKMNPFSKAWTTVWAPSKTCSNQTIISMVAGWSAFAKQTLERSHDTSDCSWTMVKQKAVEWSLQLGQPKIKESLGEVSIAGSVSVPKIGWSDRDFKKWSKGIVDYSGSRTSAKEVRENMKTFTNEEKYSYNMKLDSKNFDYVVADNTKGCWKLDFHGCRFFNGTNSGSSNDWYYAAIISNYAKR